MRFKWEKQGYHYHLSIKGINGLQFRITEDMLCEDYYNYDVYVDNRYAYEFKTLDQAKQYCEFKILQHLKVFLFHFKESIDIEPNEQISL